MTDWVKLWRRGAARHADLCARFLVLGCDKEARWHAQRHEKCRYRMSLAVMQRDLRCVRRVDWVRHVDWFGDGDE